MYKALVICLFLKSALCSLNFFLNLSQSQIQPLHSYKLCIIRTVFLKNSNPASKDVLSLLNYFRNQATFIIESIPFEREQYITNTSQSTARPINMKFLTCNTIFYFQDQLMEAGFAKLEFSHYTMICDYFSVFTITVRDENPSSVVFISFRTTNSSFFWKYYACLQNIHITSSMYSLSLHGADGVPNNFVFPIPVDVSGTTPWHYWDTVDVNSFYTCAVSLERLTSQKFNIPQNCLFRVAKRILNLTEEKSRDAYGFASFTSPNDFVKHIVDYVFKNTSSRFKLVPYGMVVELYQFGTTISPAFYRINSLVEPFDTPTWIFLFGSTGCLCLFFRIHFQRTGNRSLLETHVLSILLEQSQDITTEFKRLGKQASVLLIGWLLLTFLVGNAYKGVLFTLLTTPSVPVVPQTLKQVVQSNYSAVTTETTMLYTLDLFLRNTEQDYTARYNISSAVNLYRKLWDKTTLIFTLTSHLFVDMKTSGVIQGLVQNHSIPKEMIIVDPEKNMNFLKELNTVFTKNVVILGEKLNLLSERKQWCFRRNGFLTLILPILSGLTESGIYKRWEYFSQVMSTYMDLLEIKTKLSKGSKELESQFSLKGNILAYLLFKPYTAKPNSESAEPIRMELFVMFLTVFGYSVVICSSVFLVESFSRMKAVEKLSKLYSGFKRSAALKARIAVRSRN